MKKLKLFGLFLFISLTLFAEESKTINSKINEVTLFLSKAQISRSASFRVPAGQTTLIIDGISGRIQVHTLQVKGEGNFIILDVQHKLKYPEPQPVGQQPLPDKILREIAQLKDSLIDLGFKLSDLNLRIEALDLERNMLLNNKLMIGDGKADTMPVLRDAMQFFREKLSDIITLQVAQKRLLQNANAKKAIMQARLVELQSYNARTNKPPADNSPSHQIHVTVSSLAAVSGKLKYNYLVDQAGWSPSYDIRGESVDRPLSLLLKANVYQNTGVDWKAVRMNLSTNNPDRGHTKPELPVWFVGYYQAVKDASRSGYMLDNVTDDVAEMAQKEEQGNAPQAQALMSMHYTQTVQTMANVEYRVSLPFNLASDGVQHLVAVKQFEMPADYMHYLVPKLDREAFLVGRIADWDEYELLPAVANIYYDGTFVGRTNINPSTMSDTLELALGRDIGIIAERKKVKDTEKQKLIGGQMVHDFTWEIKIKSKLKRSTILIVEDHIPVAGDNSIEVELADEEGFYSVDLGRGRVSWKLVLPTGGEKELSYSYTVKHDKDRPLSQL